MLPQAGKAANLTPALRALGASRDCEAVAATVAAAARTASADAPLPPAEARALSLALGTVAERHAAGTLAAARALSSRRTQRALDALTAAADAPESRKLAARPAADGAARALLHAVVNLFAHDAWCAHRRRAPVPRAQRRQLGAQNPRRHACWRHACCCTAPPTRPKPSAAALLAARLLFAPADAAPRRAAPARELDDLSPAEPKTKHGMPPRHVGARRAPWEAALHVARRRCESLHALRKAVREVRYMMEAYAPLYDAVPAYAAQMAALSALQAHIGTMRDVEVSLQSLPELVFCPAICGALQAAHAGAWAAFRTGREPMLSPRGRAALYNAILAAGGGGSGVVLAGAPAATGAR